MLTPSASSPDVTKDKDNVFQVCFTDPNQGTGAADYIAENMTGAKVAVIYRNDDAYSQGIRDTFVKEAEAKGAFEIVSETTFTDATSTDFTVQLTAAKNAGADLVFLPIYYQPASVILSQAKAMSYEPTFFGVDGMDGILTMPGFDASLAEGVMLLTPFSADSEDAADPELRQDLHRAVRRGRPTSSPPTPMTACTSSRPLLRSRRLHRRHELHRHLRGAHPGHAHPQRGRPHRLRP